MLIATIVTSLGYRFGEAVFIGTMFLPGSVVAKYFYQRVSFIDRDSVVSAVSVTLGIIGYIGYSFMNKPFSSATNDGHSHTYAEEYTVDTPATCTAEGVESRHCTVEGCEAHIDDRKISKTDHTYNDGKITKEPTCTEEGTKVYTCKVCGKEKTETVFPIDHAYGPGTVEVQATCTTEGKVHYVCTRCNYETDEVVPATGHDLNTNVFTDDSDPAEIKYYKTCKNCQTLIYTDESGNVLPGQEEILTTPIESVVTGTPNENCKAGKHDFVEAGAKLDATCGKEGHKTLVCKNCGTTKTETIPALSHEFEEITTPSTCAQQGTVVSKCKNCGYIESTKYLDLVGHTFDGGSVVQEGDCTHDRIVKYTCTVCGFQKTQTSSANGGHNFEKTTYEEDGKRITEDKCTRCGTVRSRVVVNTETGTSSGTVDGGSSSQIIINN